MEKTEIENIEERIGELEESFNVTSERIKGLKERFDLSKIESLLLNIEKKISNFEKNANRFDDMVKELNGSVTRCRALFSERKNNTPVWYEISKVQPPERGTIWIKDIDGNQTMARCEGKSIIYQSSEFIKSPEFWKPV